MRNRVYVVAAEYSAPLSALTDAGAAGYRELADPDRAGLFREVFFTAPGDTHNWPNEGAQRVPTLADLLTSAAHRALASFHELCGNARYGDTRRSITDLLVASMPLLGATPGGGINAGLVPLMLRSALGLEFECHCQFVAGTADSGAGGFASAVRIAQSRPATILVSAGQLIPSGYMGTYRIRSVFTEDEQRQGLDMMAVGDVLMDALRRTYAGPDTDFAQCRAWLADVRARKLAAARSYPAALGVTSADPEGGGKFVTPYFRADDVAKVGCGAAAVVVTSDPATLGRIRQTLASSARRYRNTPVVEVMGIGEGTTNPRLLTRHTPMSSGTSIRQALVTAASDGNLPLSVFPDSAFALLHDAFPSMELAVLLAVGLDWQRATLRMTTWWSNPCGGLLTFGDAVGASGLVQVCKAFHVFTGDRRYIPEPLQSLRHFRRAGSYAFTASIGGPLSHLVVSILRGGVPYAARDQAAFFDDDGVRVREHRSPVAGEQRRRECLQRSMRTYVDRLDEHRPSWLLVEGVTEIDARSCAQALSPAEIDALPLARLPHLVADQAVAGCRAQIVELIHQLRADLLGARDGSATYAARARYNVGLQELLDSWHERGVLRADEEILARLSLRAPADADGGGARAAAGVKRRLKALKQVIRVPAAVLISARGRQLAYMTRLDAAARAALERADFIDDRQAPSGPGAVSVVQDPTLLPWWNSRAERLRGPVDLTEAVRAASVWSERNAGASPDALVSALPGVLPGAGSEAEAEGDSGAEHVIDPRLVFDALMATRPLAEQRQAELGFLRAFFAPSGPQAAVDLAMRELGLGTEIGQREQADELVPAIFYKNDIIGSSAIANVHEAYELLGRAVQRARGWFGMYASTCAQHGDSVSLVSLDRRLEPGGDGSSEALHARTEAISNAARFARDVAEWCLGYGIRVRTVVSFGQGLPYRDVNDERSVASDSAIRGARLLDHVARAAKSLGYAGKPWIAFDLSELADIDNAAELFARELSAATGPDWCQPPGPPSPVALERWDNVRFVVWYRP